jgi:hypothetical protein
MFMTLQVASVVLVAIAMALGLTHALDHAFFRTRVSNVL